jgi:hypothetical protein
MSHADRRQRIHELVLALISQQALVRSAVTLDALVDQEVGEPAPTGKL